MTRTRRVALVVGAAVVWISACAGITAVADLDSTAFLVLLVLGVVLGAQLDNRRRAVLAQRRSDQSSAKVGGVVDRIGSSIQDIKKAQARVENATASHRAETAFLHGAVNQLSLKVDGGRADLVQQFLESQARTLASGRTDLKEAVGTLVARSRADLDKRLMTNYRQLEALALLRDVVEVTGPTPPLRGWAASPDLLYALVLELKRSTPSLVVECGSGSSTVWLAMASRSFGLSTRIVALEHDDSFAAVTERQLHECGVSQLAEVRRAPLRPVTIGSHVSDWYDVEAIEDLRDIGIVLVDGPPGTTGPLARYPAMHLLASRMTPTATVFLDDSSRDDERTIADRWQEEFEDFVRVEIPLEKGVSVFRRSEARQGLDSPAFSS